MVYLNDERLVAETGREADAAGERVLVDEVVYAVVEAASGGRGAAVYAALEYGLASNARECVDVLVAECVRVRVGYPAHLALAGSHVGSYNNK